MGVVMIGATLFLAATDADAITGPRKKKTSNGTVKTVWGLGPQTPASVVAWGDANRAADSVTMCLGFASQTVSNTQKKALFDQGWKERVDGRTCPWTVANSSNNLMAFQGDEGNTEPDADGWVPVTFTETAEETPNGDPAYGHTYGKEIQEGYYTSSTPLWYNTNTGEYSYWEVDTPYYHPGGVYNKSYVYMGTVDEAGTPPEGVETIVGHEVAHGAGLAHGEGDPSTNGAYYEFYDAQGNPFCGAGQRDDAGVCGSSALSAASSEDLIDLSDDTTNESTTPSDSSLKGDQPNSKSGEANPGQGPKGDLPPEANEKAQPKGGDAPSEDSLSETPEAA